MRPIYVAKRHGMTRQRVHGIIQRFQAAIWEFPADRRRMDVWLPSDLAM
jgi:hypothetical protein